MQHALSVATHVSVAHSSVLDAQVWGLLVRHCRRLRTLSLHGPPFEDWNRWQVDHTLFFRAAAKLVRLNQVSVRGFVTHHGLMCNG